MCANLENDESWNLRSMSICTKFQSWRYSVLAFNVITLPSYLFTYHIITADFLFVAYTRKTDMLPPLAIASITVLVVWSSGPPVAAICTPFVYSRKADTLCVDGLATSVNSNCSSLNFSSIFGFCEVAELNDLVALETRVRILGFNGVSFYSFYRLRYCEQY